MDAATPNSPLSPVSSRAASALRNTGAASAPPQLSRIAMPQVRRRSFETEDTTQTEEEAERRITTGSGKPMVDLWSTFADHNSLVDHDSLPVDDDPPPVSARPSMRSSARNSQLPEVTENRYLILFHLRRSSILETSSQMKFKFD